MLLAISLIGPWIPDWVATYPDKLFPKKEERLLWVFEMVCIMSGVLLRFFVSIIPLESLANKVYAFKYAGS